MRLDSIGMFWEDLPTTRANKKHNRPMPAIPETGWTAPSSFPNIQDAVVIAVDTETYDPNLIELGPGWGRGDGHIIGASIGVLDRAGQVHTWYFPVRHETCKEENLDPEKVFPWLRDLLDSPNIPKVGANLNYDIGWLLTENIKVTGPLVDVQFAEALLDESAKVGLEILGQKYLGEGKESNLLYEWLSDWFGGEPNGKQRAHLYRAPPSLAGPYAESDADLPIRLAQIMLPLLEKENLTEVFRMECDLINLMVDMRMAGVSVDIAKAEPLRDRLVEREGELQLELNKLVGFDVNVNASESIADGFNALSLPYKKTAAGNPSFTKGFLANLNHPIAELILEVRKHEKLRSTFIESYILDAHVDGKLYGQFHQLRGDSGGTRSGRYSSSHPNLQNIPSRDPELAPMIRGLFIPDPGHAAWRKYDYSQIEYRMLIHFAVGEAGEEVRRYFQSHPDTDYHKYAQEVVKGLTGMTIGRKAIKGVNFGLIYGMGTSALASLLKLNREETKALMDAYFKGVPFAKSTMEAAMAEAQETGIIETVMGRKSRFDLWESCNWDEWSPATTYEKALLQYGSKIRRAYSHKALNRKLQGSAADLMKKAMLDCYKDGIFDYIGVPRLTVHDELDFSDPGGVDDGFEEMCRIMESALPLKVPVKADGEIGPDWGHVKDIED